MIKTCASIMFGVASLLCWIEPAFAHPHVFADGHVILDVDPIHELLAVTNEWQFDAAFSAFAVTGLDKNHDGKLEPSELKALAATSMASLKDYHYFTWVTRKGVEAALAPPRDYVYRFSGGRLILTFTMPLTVPVPLDNALQVEVYDPEYFVAYTFSDHGSVKLKGGSADCTPTYIPPKPLDAKIVAELASIPAEQHDLPDALTEAALGLANIFKVKCP